MADSKEDYLTLKTTTELYVFRACGVFPIHPTRPLPNAPRGPRPCRPSPPLLCRLPRLPPDTFRVCAPPALFKGQSPRGVVSTAPGGASYQPELLPRARWSLNKEGKPRASEWRTAPAHTAQTSAWPSATRPPFPAPPPPPPHTHPTLPFPRPLSLPLSPPPPPPLTFQSRGRSELSQENAAFFHAFGFGCTRRSNLHYLDDHTVMSAQGNTVMFLDTNRMTTEYMFGVEGRGIGALTVNPTKTLFVVAEKGAWPRVFIHQYVTP